MYIFSGGRMGYKHIFGPVPSRRLGRSLGVDLVPFKICNLDCVYCECGTTGATVTVRARYSNPDEIVSEIKDLLDKKPAVDYVTLTGSGEPTLSIDLAYIIRFIKREYPELKIALLTNGVLFSDSAVRNESALVDVVLPSLDAAQQESFRIIDRPAAGVSIERIIDGLKHFRDEYKGQIWLEQFIIPGINDTEEELLSFKTAMGLIKPDKIQINSLDRPGAENWVKAAHYQELMAVREFYFPYNAEIVGRFISADKNDSKQDLNIDIILSILKRRPCTVKDIEIITGKDINKIDDVISELINKGLVEVITINENEFYRILL